MPPARLSRSESKARTRDRLLLNARRIFRDRGYAAASLEEIARASGVTKAAIYRHFASKEDLFIAVAERYSTVVDASPLDDPNLSVAERLAKIGTVMAATQPDLLEFAASLEHRAASLRTATAQRRLATLLSSILAEVVRQRGVEPDTELASGVTAIEVAVLGQIIVDGLTLYHAVLPEIVTEDTFVTAWQMLTALLPEPTDSSGSSGRGPK